MDEFFRYWGQIALPIVFKKSIEGSGMKIAFWTFVISLVVMVVSVILFLINVAPTDWVDLTVEQVKNFGIAFGVSSFIAFVSFCGLVLTVPPEINKTKENEINHLDNELNSVAPNIQVSGVIDVRDVPIGHRDVNGAYVLSHITNIASVPFANSPISPNRNNNARNIRAEIYYLDENKTAILTSIQGRWGGIEPGEINSGDKTILESAIFPNNSAKRWLDLVMKYPEDEYCYAYSNDSYVHGYFLHPNQIIESKRFYIHVKLMGEYIPNNVFEFEVITKGKGDTFQIRHDEKWIKTKNSQATKTPQKAKLSQKRKSSRKKPI